MDQETEQHWYQFPWVWVLILIPFTAVLFGIVMFVMADIHRDDMVVDDYYKDGMAINLQLSMDTRAGELEVSATLVSIYTTGVVIRIEHATDSAVQLDLYHVANRDKDYASILLPGEDATKFLYASDDIELVKLLTSKGVWFLELTGVDESWRLRRRIETPITALVLRP